MKKWNTPNIIPNDNPKNKIEMELDNGDICWGWYENGKFLCQTIGRLLDLTNSIVKWKYTGLEW